MLVEVPDGQLRFIFSTAWKWSVFPSACRMKASSKLLVSTGQCRCDWWLPSQKTKQMLHSIGKFYFRVWRTGRWCKLWGRKFDVWTVLTRVFLLAVLTSVTCPACGSPWNAFCFGFVDWPCQIAGSYNDAVLMVSNQLLRCAELSWQLVNVMDYGQRLWQCIINHQTQTPRCVTHFFAWAELMVNGSGAFDSSARQLPLQLVPASAP